MVVGSQINQLISPLWPQGFEIARGEEMANLGEPRKSTRACISHVPKLNTYQSSRDRRSRRTLLLLLLFISKRYSSSITENNHCLSSHSRRGNTVPPPPYTHTPPYSVSKALTDQHGLVVLVLFTNALARVCPRETRQPGLVTFLLFSLDPRRCPSQVSNTKNLETLISFVRNSHYYLLA